MLNVVSIDDLCVHVFTQRVHRPLPAQRADLRTAPPVASLSDLAEIHISCEAHATCVNL